MIHSFDLYFYHLVNTTLTADWLDFLMLKFSDKIFWIPFYCVVIWFLSKQYGKQVFLVLIFLGLAVFASDRISSGLIKPLVNRQRPCLETSLSTRDIGEPCNDTGSMPSSHASNHFAIAFFIILLQGLRKKLNTIFWLVWAFLIAYSRVYCGVHYPTDVIAGGFLGIGLGACSYYLYKLVENKIKWQ